MLVGDIFQDRRQLGNQSATTSRPNPHQPLVCSQPIPPGDLPDDSPLPDSPIRDTAITERDAQLLVDLRWASVMAIPRSQSWAISCRYRCRLLQSRSSFTGAGGNRAEATITAVEDGQRSRPCWKKSGTAAHWGQQTREKNCAAADRGRALCLHSQRIDQQSLDAIIAFAGAGQRRRLLRILDILSQVGYRRCSRRAPFPPQYAAHFPEERQRSHNKNI